MEIKGRLDVGICPTPPPARMLFHISSCDFSALRSICKSPGGAEAVLSKKRFAEVPALDAVCPNGQSDFPV